MSPDKDQQTNKSQFFLINDDDGAAEKWKMCSVTKC